MHLNDYHFVTRLRVQCELTEVVDIIGNPADLRRWWPTVYLVAKILEPSGDFAGRGVLTFEQDSEWVQVAYEWDVRANKPLLRNFSFIFRPIFEANHWWAMRMGEESLKRELAGRHAPTPEAEADVPEPPQPTSPSPATMTIGMAGIWLGLGMAAAVLYRVLRSRRRSRRE